MKTWKCINKSIIEKYYIIMAGLFFGFFFFWLELQDGIIFQLNVAFQQLWIPTNACFPLSIKLT